MFGTADNYNTQYTERLHIDLAKKAYQATNRKDEYSQMTIWLERQEKKLTHAKYIKARKLGIVTGGARPMTGPAVPGFGYQCHSKIAKWPAARGVALTMLANTYGAVSFQEVCAHFIIGWSNPETTESAITQHTRMKLLMFNKVNIFHHIEYTDTDVYNINGAYLTVDSIHVHPGHQNNHGTLLHG